MSTSDHGRTRTDGSRPFVFPPPGLDVCGTCGEFRGTTHRKWLAGYAAGRDDQPVTARCTCRTCGRCGLTIRSREPRHRWHDEAGDIWLHRGTPDLSAICPHCRQPSGPAVRTDAQARKAIATWFAANHQVPGSPLRLGSLYGPGSAEAPRSSWAAPAVDFRAGHYWHQSLYLHPCIIVDGPSYFVVLDGRNGEVVYLGEGFG